MPGHLRTYGRKASELSDNDLAVLAKLLVESLEESRIRDVEAA